MMNIDENQFFTVRGYQLQKQGDSELTSAMEDYLEMIRRLCMQDGYARVGVLATNLQVRPSSASKMVSKLRELGYLRYDQNDSILLTPKGTQVSDYLLYRHNTIERFLALIGSPNTLEETEKLEHSMSSDTVERLNLLLQLFEQSPALVEHYKTLA